MAFYSLWHSFDLNAGGWWAHRRTPSRKTKTIIYCISRIHLIFHFYSLTVVPTVSHVASCFKSCVSLESTIPDQTTANNEEIERKMKYTKIENRQTLKIERQNEVGECDDRVSRRMSNKLKLRPWSRAQKETTDPNRKQPHFVPNFNENWVYLFCSLMLELIAPMKWALGGKLTVFQCVHVNEKYSWNDGRQCKQQQSNAAPLHCGLRHQISFPCAENVDEEWIGN